MYRTETLCRRYFPLFLFNFSHRTTCWQHQLWHQHKEVNKTSRCDKTYFLFLPHSAFQSRTAVLIFRNDSIMASFLIGTNKYINRWIEKHAVVSFSRRLGWFYVRFYLHWSWLLFVFLILPVTPLKKHVISCPRSIYSPRRLCTDFCPRGCLFTILSPIKKKKEITQRTHEYQKQLHAFTYKLRYVYQTLNINVQTWFPCGRSVFFCGSILGCLCLNYFCFLLLSEQL